MFCIPPLFLESIVSLVSEQNKPVFFAFHDHFLKVGPVVTYIVNIYETAIIQACCVRGNYAIK